MSSLERATQRPLWWQNSTRKKFSQRQLIVVSLHIQSSARTQLQIVTMADNLDIGKQNAQPLVQPKVRLTKNEQKEEKKLKKELESKRAAEERAENLRLEIEAKEKVKKEAIEKKRLELND